MKMLELLILLILLIAVGYIVIKLTLAVLRWLAVNAITGLLLLGVLNFLGITHIPLNLVNFLIIAVGGVVGVFILILLSLI
ncbi:pro-sigmaK processing inhibitor BofA family protein [Thermococcus waiotapuensis]|uniref:Pro-sigmaK processing inhibitor BofA family protein n=1 Tax=Thermococcus waiotapuensis TaxID=90909 RepID=A0AAE4NYR7_9EURY|nr:pro-sigmaK processing inhibitor BofA family protein [Thermococcus waiotapuensis]MDV3104776.1 pro-sigmaK processing inhibitor BofA family protein [Thermococcus waiotapuensis]